MTATAVRKDQKALTMTMSTEFDATPERVWQLWADPRQLERWWGPPTYPATVTTHDLEPGGRVEYHMTGPEGDQPRGYWEITKVDPPHLLVFNDGFANDDGTPNTDLPATEARVRITDVGNGRTSLEIESLFPSAEAMEQVLAMGMEEGMKQAIGQIKAVLASDNLPEPETHTLEVPGAVLSYDVRHNPASTKPMLLLIGSPMGAAGFGTLSKHFSDRSLVTYDPRGSERSITTDPASPSNPDEHADDLHRLITTLDAGAVDIFASSGGAVNALVLVAKHPELVQNLIAHEPPAVHVLPDREAALAATRNVSETYQKQGMGWGMAKFIALASNKGEVPTDFADQPVDPAMFGMPTDDDGTRDDVLLGQNLVAGTSYEFDFEALAQAPTRIVLAAGAESEGELAHRAAKGVAERLGKSAVTFPSHHGGFLGGEYGQQGDPDAFAAKLREVLG
ncbi:MAG: SRPBCC domain-containing protein [Acidimicrobiia bacterium]|nr:SRPBCC domain-containing protein [Acidimicrobiia bacterium]